MPPLHVIYTSSFAANLVLSWQHYLHYLICYQLY